MSDDILTDDTSIIRDPDKGVKLYSLAGESREEEFFEKIREYMVSEEESEWNNKCSMGFPILHLIDLLMKERLHGINSILIGWWH